MAIKQWALKHPVATFIVLTMAWSWSIWFPIFLIIKPGDFLNQMSRVIPFMLLGNSGPVLIGVTLTGLLYGRQGLQALGARLRDLHAGGWWLALLVIPLAYALLLLLRWFAGYPIDPGAILGRVGIGLGMGIFAALTEEIGWRGFLLPHLLKRHSPLVAALLVGLVWGGLWHGYANYVGLGHKGWAFWPLDLLQGPGLLTAWSLILTRVYQHTRGSLLRSMLMHISITFSGIIFEQSYSTLNEELVWWLIMVGLAWLVAGGFWLATRPAHESQAAPAPLSVG